MQLGLLRIISMVSCFESITFFDFKVVVGPRNSLAISE